MSSEPTVGEIHAEQIWKRFRQDRQRTLLRDELQRMRRRLRGDEAGWTWALRDVSLHVERGDSVGLIGSNGSGKSTFLKILTRVMFPHTGRVTVGGRVGALIEVSSGIHNDLTGRENIFLYGNLLGLPRKVIAARFDEIVGFSGLEGAVDRQVKFYSSGMRIRLGFAIASHLEPDVFLVDEVLSVGDAEFQQRCLTKMRQVLNEGTTVVYVSHDLASVEAICSRGMWLDQGVVRAQGTIDEALAAYRASIESAAVATENLTGPVRPVEIAITGPDGGSVRTQQPMRINVELENRGVDVNRVYLGVTQGDTNPLFVFKRSMSLPHGRSQIVCDLPRVPLPGGQFYLYMSVEDRKKELLPWNPVASFEVIGPGVDPAPRAIARRSPMHVEAHWGGNAE